VLTTSSKNSGSGQNSGGSGKFEYVKEPQAAHVPGSANNPESWWIDGVSYTYANKEWHVQPEGERSSIQATLDYARKPGYFKSGKFTGQEDYKGTPANHFTFELSDLVDNLGDWNIKQADGEAYLSVEGNYLLYFHEKLSGTVIVVPGKSGWFPGTMESTQELTQINQPLQIALPASYPNFALDLGLALPVGTSLSSINSYPPAAGGLFYKYKTGVNVNDFLNFYQSAALNNGWSIVQAGQFKKPEYCYQGCVIFRRDSDPKGAEWVMLWANEITTSALVFYYHPKGVKIEN